MSSLPASAEDVRISAGPGHRKSCTRRLCLPCAGCLALVGLIVGLSVGLTGKNPAKLADDAYHDLGDAYDEYFGEKRDDPAEDDRGTITVTSTEWTYGQPLPERYTSDGEDVSPPLLWTDLPPGTRSLVVLAEDHDYPNPSEPGPEPWVHWVCYDVNPDLFGLREGLPREAEMMELVDVVSGESMPAGASVVTTESKGEEEGEWEEGEEETTETPGPLRQGSTSWKDDVGYRGPDPPAGDEPHRYYFRVLALDGTVADKLPGNGNGNGEGGGGEVASYRDILDVVEGDDAEVKVLGFGLLMGTYQKA